MEHEAPSTDRSPFTRLEAVRDADCDALVDLFLGEADPVNRFVPPERPHRTGSRLDLVIANHLDQPDETFEQFCQSAAEVSPQKLGCVRHAGAGWVAWVHGRRLAFGERRATISTAVADVARRCERVVVLLPKQDEVGRLVAGLNGLSDPPDNIIVLSTTREPDVVASYRQVKSIAALADQQLSLVQVHVVGDSAEACESACRRLSETSERFLEFSLPTCIHVFADEATESESGSPGGPDLLDAPEVEDPVRAFMQEAFNEIEAPETGKTQDMVTQATAACEAFANNVAAEAGTDLLSVFPGFEPLDLPGFDCDRVQLAIDGSGHVHAFAGCLGAPLTAEAERGLARAGAFVARHAPLLAALDTRLGAGNLVSHLVSDRYSDLAPLIGGPIRLHLAVRVDVAGRTHWGVSDLAH